MITIFRFINEDSIVKNKLCWSSLKIEEKTISLCLITLLISQPQFLIEWIETLIISIVELVVQLLTPGTYVAHVERIWH